MNDFLYNIFTFLPKETVDNIVYFLLIVLTFYIFNKFLKDTVKKLFKIYYLKKRDHQFNKFIFPRYDYLLKPITYAVNLYLLTHLINIFVSSLLIDKIIFLGYVFIFLIFMYEIIKFFLHGALIRKVEKEKETRRELFNLFLNITKIILILIAFLLTLTQSGIDVTALVTSFGIGGAILALSAKDTLTNFFDSIRLISSDAFRQGDWIQTDYVDGFVTEIGLVSTKVRTFSNSFVTIPNTKLANNYIKNWSKRLVGRKIKFNIKLKIQNDKNEVDHVIDEILNMLNNHKDIVNDEKLQHLINTNRVYENGLFNIADKYGVRKTMLVYLDKIDTYSMDILVYVFSVSIEWERWLQTKQDVLKDVIDIIDKSKLEFAYPKEEIMLDLKKGVSPDLKE